MDQPLSAPERYEFDGYLIRPYAPDDAAALARTTNASYEHLRPWMIWARDDQTVESAEETCRNMLAGYEANEDFTLGVWLGDELVGSTGFHLRWGRIENRVAEIGMWVSASHSGKGLGTRLLTAMLEWGFTEWNWRRLVWQCDTRNVASARVAQKCGLRLEATFKQDMPNLVGGFRDTHLFAMLLDEWRQPARS